MTDPRRVCLALAGALALLAPAPWTSAQQARRVLGSEHLRILHWPQHADLAELARETGEGAMMRLQRMLDAEPPERIEVYIVRTQAEFDALTGGGNKPWVVGRALPSALRVVVKPMGPQRLPKLLAHELAHVMLDVAMGEAAWELPRWLHEGIAKYAADDFDAGERQLIARAALSGELLGLDELEAAFAGDVEQVSLAYAQSYTLVAYLSSLEPAKGIRPLLDQIAKGREMRLALGLAFGRPVPEMEQEWLSGLQRGYWPYLAPPWSEAVIGALFVLALAMAVVMVRRRSARIRRRMLEQEQGWQPAAEDAAGGPATMGESATEAGRDDSGPVIE
ncbi:MAG: peptidase MA family metallohydrolase [Armatimonadota bacterium]